VDDPNASTLDELLKIDHLIYGSCFHPRFVDNGYLYLVTNGPTKGEPKHNRIVRYTISKESPHGIDPRSELVILQWESNGHNGGELAFGPDGMLYCVTGDGTSDSDPLHTGQGLNDYLAVMLRLDVDHPEKDRPYSVPKDNPFIDVPEAKPEIWAFGFRNPWRMTFDRKTGHLWVGQNGQDLWEQVYVVERGGNYGWSVQEGSHPFYLERPRGPGEIRLPVVEHHHVEARSLTGGVVYYGSKLPELQGAYIYGDYSTGNIWGVRYDGRKVTWHQELVDTPFAIVGFTETPGGDLFVIDQHTGFYKLEPNPPPTTPLPKFPTKLSETGLFTAVAKHHVAPGVIPYSVNAALWSDGSHKERFLALPGDEFAEFTQNGKSWNFPDGTVLVKSFALERTAGDPNTRRWIETRIMTRQQKEWVGYTYEWNDEQTDAVLVESSGKDRDFTIREAGGERKQSWHYPSRAECMVCHSRAANFVLGLQTEQLNRDQQYGERTDNQLRTLAHIGVIRTGGKHADLPKPAEEYPHFANPYDETKAVEERVRTYLHVNCAICHQWAGGGNAALDLLSRTAIEKTQLLDGPVLHNKFDITDARIIAPGDPERSVLLHRMKLRGRGQMPPIASSRVDDPAVKLMEAWIRGLPKTVPEKTGGD
ncbi:MAG TPA: PQQ-dependent sugar dehydrogenase, partial [Planctomycetaceae bacterium]|nr:PQQ-dependent sugar dehydrogenase [Planctomycetaceae bacterium]